MTPKRAASPRAILSASRTATAPSSLRSVAHTTNRNAIREALQGECRPAQLLVGMPVAIRVMDVFMTVSRRQFLEATSVSAFLSLGRSHNAPLGMPRGRLTRPAHLSDGDSIGLISPVATPPDAADAPAVARVLDEIGLRLQVGDVAGGRV